jgi:hypothetical protein
MIHIDVVLPLRIPKVAVGPHGQDHRWNDMVLPGWQLSRLFAASSLAVLFSDWRMRPAG